MTNLQDSYDYVVCGGGSAGCVVAARLSEDPNHSVLLLEAGPSDLDWLDTHIPSLTATLQRSKIDWDYKCKIKGKSYLAYEDVRWTRGKVLGGCGSHNAMAYTRCSAADYDSWEKLGCEGWSWKDVLPYFLKAENDICPGFAGSELHNIGGPVTISTPHRPTAVSSAFIQAGLELGYKTVDVMSGDIIGFGDFPATIDADGKRASTARAYVHPAMKRSNFTVLCNTHVTKVDIQDKKAVGVFFRTDVGDKRVAVNKEVIVSGGAVNSPQLLLLSGVGPKSHLEEFGIECVADLPVGQNLQDHLCMHMKVSVKAGSQVNTFSNFPVDNNGAEATGFIQTGLEEPNVDSPDMQLVYTGGFFPFGIDEDKIFVLKNPKFQPILSQNMPREERLVKEGFTIFPIFIHPKSVGEIKLASADPMAQPFIDPNYFDHHYDVKAMIKGIRVAKQLLETKAMVPFECKLNCLKMPGSKDDEWSDENLEAYARHYACTLYHPTSTCKMGAKDDPTAVVDPQLRVRGIEGLRVIDASIMPNVTSGNTNAPCIMIGEKGADLIINGGK
ncbi:uncharacterized GMC-type oxidoreductase Mb1310-like [Amphiura filiformis]|uniref:uncharacterized GMC-type oxidoreductase Mb1310-like n=1 Tax=Amphiura filiformis TaxID=82378 RepID=UPI003B21CD4A